jgi:hypothetical protein
MTGQRDGNKVVTTEPTAAPMTVILCGPGTQTCRCECVSGGPCEHRWDGPGAPIADGQGSSATCSQCGKLAIDHDLWVLP